MTTLFCCSNCSNSAFSLSWVPLTFSHHCVCVCMFITYLLSGTIRCFSLILYSYYLVLQSAISPRSPGSFHWRMVFEIKISSSSSTRCTHEVQFICVLCVCVCLMSDLKRLCLTQGHKGLLLHFKNFIVLVHSSRPTIHFEFIFVHGI